MMQKEKNYEVYIVRCADNSLYTGIALDARVRVHEHNESEKGAKYTKARRPVELVYQERCSSRSEAQKREWEIKSMSRRQKESLLL